MALPNTKVEIAFDSGYTTAAASRTWTDVTAYVEASQSISITRGRQDEVSQVTPSTLSLTLNNRDGRFTPERAASPYYPNVKKGRPIRVTTTYNAVTYVRFVGYINGWPVTWPDSTDADSTVAITATSRIARLGVGAMLVGLTPTEILTDQPYAYYPLSDAVGSLSAQDSSGNARAPLQTEGSGANPLFGVAEIATGSGTCATLAGKNLRADYSAAPTVTAAECVFATTGVSAIDNLLEVGGRSIRLESPGVVAYQGISSASGFNDGQPHHVAIRYAAGSVSLYLDGVSVGSTVQAPAAGTTLVVGSDETASFSSVAIYTTAPSAARLISHASAALSGHVGDAAGERIERYATFAGIASAELAVDAGVSTIGFVETDAQTPIALMQKVVETENGVLYDAKDGSLVFKDRDHRYNMASSFTLSATAQEVEADLTPAYDDQFLVNDVTATALDGIAARVFDTTSTSDYGFYRQSLDLVNTGTADAEANAQWRVGLGKDPRTRYSTVGVDIVNSSTSQAALVLAAEIGTRFGLSNLPAQAPSPTADLFVEGSTETITHAAHLVTFNTSPTYGYAGSNGVWQLDVNNIDGPYVLAL